MARWEIDRFGVKPEGFLAKWRYVIVYVDEFGNITNETPPGKESINKNSLLDYTKNDRNYVSSQEITRYCNLSTFTRYIITAINVKPWATTTAIINSPECGYQEPLPEPFNPPNPFGDAPYGLYAYLNFCDTKNIPISVKIYKRNFSGSATQIKNGGATPIILKYKNNDDNKFTPIRSCDAQLTLVSEPNFSLEQFYTEDEREFKMQVQKAGITKFLGFVTASDASEEFRATPYDITIKANDGLGALKKIDYPLPLGARVDMQQKLIEILCYALAMTNLNLDVATIVNLYEVKMSNGLNDDPLAQATVNPLQFNDKGKALTCYQVLEKLCLQFGAFIVQDNGAWVFARQSELAGNVVRKRTYNYKGFYVRGEQYSTRRIASCNGDDIKILDDSPVLRIGNAYKRTEVVVNFGEEIFLVYNGDFELYKETTKNWPGWTKYGGIKVSRIEKQIRSTTGNIPSGNYAIQFDEFVDNGKYIETQKIDVHPKDKINLSFNVGYTGGEVQLKMRIILAGAYFLTNPNGDNNFEWIAQLVTCTLTLNNPSDVNDAYTASMEIPEFPGATALNLDGTVPMVIEIFGFSTTGTYQPIYIDNVKIKRTSANKIGRVLYIAQQDGFYTTKPEVTELIFGDGILVKKNSFFSLFGGKPKFVTEAGAKTDDHIIRTKDGSYSTGWYEFGGSPQPAPIGLILARAMLKAYQKPFRFFEGSFLGDNISYLDIFNVNLPNSPEFNERIFALLSGDFDLVSGELNNANYVEIFSRPGKSVDMIIPGNMGDPFPPMIQNPNPPVQSIEGIFTDEFSEQFK